MPEISDNTFVNNKILIGQPPAQKEILEKTLLAILQYYDIDLQTFYSPDSRRDLFISTIRHEFVFLIKANTDLGTKKLSQYCKVSRNVIRYGVEKIEVHKKIYGQTLRNLDAVVKICNSFEKKHEWHLHN